ncbi:MAG: hypothetical protein WCK82_03280 [Bacteroidota bacterium]
MFKSKYKVTLIDSKWNVVKNNIKLSVLPRRDEYVFFDGLYYLVLNVVHVLDGKQGVFVIINETPYQLKQA